MGTSPPSSSLVSLGGSSAPEERHGPIWPKAYAHYGPIQPKIYAQHGPARSEDSGKPSDPGLGGQGLLVAKSIT